MVCCFLLSIAAADDELMMKMMNATVTIATVTIATVTIAITATNNNS